MKNTETIIDLHRNDMKFSVAHFTIFSPTVREKIHGHNYYLRAKITAAVTSLGLAFDYRDLRKTLIEKCKYLNESFLIPGLSPYLDLEELAEKKSVTITFNNESMTLLKKDITVLPLINISSEALSSWFLSHLIKDKKGLLQKNISEIEVIISTTTGHACSTQWKKNA